MCSASDFIGPTAHPIASAEWRSLRYGKLRSTELNKTRMTDRRAELRQIIRNKREQRTGGASRAPHAMPDPQTLMLAAGIDDAEALRNAPALMDVARQIASSSGGMRNALEHAARATHAAERPPEEARKRRGGKRHRPRKHEPDGPGDASEALVLDEVATDRPHDGHAYEVSDDEEEAPPPASDEDDEAPPPMSDDEARA